ncbi:MAG: hypothetical protein WBB34_06635 [Xanthobacteraceae bacterium]
MIVVEKDPVKPARAVFALFWRRYFGPQGGLTAISGVPVCLLLIIALPGGPVLPPIVSSLPTLFAHPVVLPEAVAPPD